MVSFRIGSVLGIPIKLGLSFLLVIPVLTFLIGSQMEPIVEALELTFGTAIDAGALTGGSTPWLLGLLAALGLFASVLLHELGHSVVAMRYGIDIEGITLWFLGGLAQLTELPDRWGQELAIAVAGPIVSVAIGVLCYVGFVLVPPEFPALLFLLGYLAILNVVVAAFNMLPGFPMDGGRVLRSLLSRDRSRVQATRIAAGVGKAFAIALGIGGILLANIFWIAIAFFIYLAAASETRQVIVEAALEGLTVREIMTPASALHTVTSETTLDELLDRMLRERHTGYPVLDRGELVGIVTLEDIQERAPESPETVQPTVRDVMSRDLVTVSPETKATSALRTLQGADIGRILVTGEDGALVGLVSRTDLLRILEIVQAGHSTEAVSPPVEQ